MVFYGWDPTLQEANKKWVEICQTPPQIEIPSLTLSILPPLFSNYCTLDLGSCVGEGEIEVFSHFILITSST